MSGPVSSDEWAHTASPSVHHGGISLGNRPRLRTMQCARTRPSSLFLSTFPRAPTGCGAHASYDGPARIPCSQGCETKRRNGKKKSSRKQDENGAEGVLQQKHGSFDERRTCLLVQYPSSRMHSRFAIAFVKGCTSSRHTPR